MRAINVVSAQSCLYYNPATGAVQIRFFRYPLVPTIASHSFLQFRFFMFACSYVFLRIRFFRFVSSDCFFRLISSDLFLHICFVQSPPIDVACSLSLPLYILPRQVRALGWLVDQRLCVVHLWIVLRCASLDCASLALQVVLNWRAGHASQLKLSSYVRLKVIQHLFLVCLLFCWVFVFILLFESFVFVSWFQPLQISQIHLFVHISHDSQIS